MKKENFISLIMGVVGGILFAIGMCMCLIQEWGASKQGIFLGIMGLIILLLLIYVRRKMQGKPPIKLTFKAIITTIIGIVGVLLLGIGFCMTSIFELFVQGIIIGIVGIILLICLIPICKGIK